MCRKVVSSQDVVVKVSNHEPAKTVMFAISCGSCSFYVSEPGEKLIWAWAVLPLCSI